MGDYGHTEIIRPQDNFIRNREGRGVLQVQRISHFRNTGEIYIIGKVCEGTISKTMKALVHGENVKIVSLDCKFAKNVECVGSGYNVLITANYSDIEELVGTTRMEFVESCSA